MDIHRQRLMENRDETEVVGQREDLCVSEIKRMD